MMTGPAGNRPTTAKSDGRPHPVDDQAAVVPTFGRIERCAIRANMIRKSITESVIQTCRSDFDAALARVRESAAICLIGPNSAITACKIGAYGC